MKPFYGSKVLKTILFGLFATFIANNSLLAEELTAEQVVQKVEDRYTGDTSITDMTMILIDRKGNQRVRQIKGYTKEYGKDTKSISFFMSPADVKNTAFLSYDWDNADKEDDNWLYLPALRKVKRISAGDKSDSFMGSDFTYADMNGLEITEWTYKFLKKSEMVNGHDCWVIEARPKKSIKRKVVKESGYLKRISWVRKDIFMAIKAKMWVKKGKKIKYFSIPEVEKVQGIWTAKKLEMVTTKRKRKEHATVLLIKNPVYNKGVDDNMFTTQRMERGL